MTDEENKTLSCLRLEHAEECLAAAKSLLLSENCKSAVNRSYYAVFHAMRAVLALDGFDSKRHSGIIAEFRRRYIKTGIFESSLSKTISVLFDLRTDSDYDDFFVVSRSDAAKQTDKAEEFVCAIKRYLEYK